MSAATAPNTHSAALPPLLPVRYAKFVPKLELLLTTAHEKGDGPIGWIGPSKTARVVVLQGGHDKNAHTNPNWQRLVRNAILWSGKRT